MKRSFYVKLKNIDLNSNNDSIRAMPLSVEAGEVWVSGTVEAVRDPLGTGDSPTEYDIEISKIEDIYGDLIDESDITKESLKEINQKVINEY